MRSIWLKRFVSTGLVKSSKWLHQRYLQICILHAFGTNIRHASIWKIATYLFISAKFRDQSNTKGGNFHEKIYCTVDTTIVRAICIVFNITWVLYSYVIVVDKTIAHFYWLQIRNETNNITYYKCIASHSLRAKNNHFNDQTSWSRYNNKKRQYLKPFVAFFPFTNQTLL